MVPVICVDGPSGSGKGTLAQRLASHLGFHLLDSGALYRIVGFAALDQGIAWDDEASVTQIARDLDVTRLSPPISVFALFIAAEMSPNLCGPCVAERAPLLLQPYPPLERLCLPVNASWQRRPVS